MAQCLATINIDIGNGKLRSVTINFPAKNMKSNMHVTNWKNTNFKELTSDKDQVWSVRWNHISAISIYDGWFLAFSSILINVHEIASI